MQRIAVSIYDLRGRRGRRRLHRAAVVNVVVVFDRCGSWCSGCRSHCRRLHCATIVAIVAVVSFACGQCHLPFAAAVVGVNIFLTTPRWKKLVIRQ